MDSKLLTLVKVFGIKLFIQENLMKTRRNFLNYLFMVITAFATLILAISCGAKPDTETEPSPEWPPKE